MNNKTYLTKQGLVKLQTELEELKARQQHLVTQIEEVAQPDETGEDGLVVQLKAELEVVNDKIDKLEEAIANSEILNDKNNSNHIVQIGSRVKIRISGRLEKEFHIVSNFESDPTQNKISNESPLGLALLGKKLNEEIEVDAPVGKITYKIVSIS
jgi:transcription elongation factor GreA